MKFVEHKIAKADSEEKILPMINVVFLLLIFFMIAGTLTVNQPFELDAPLSQSETPVQQQSVIIFISSKGALALDSKKLSEQQILQEIATLIKVAPTTYFEIKADRSAQGNQVITLMNKLKDLGVKKVNLVTEKRGA